MPNIFILVVESNAPVGSSHNKSLGFFVIALAIEGKQFPSEQFAKEIEQATLKGHSEITFIIGGSLGLSLEVKKRANRLMSFGLLTFPHQLMRLVLVEQIYRAFMIQQGSPYHK